MSGDARSRCATCAIELVGRDADVVDEISLAIAPGRGARARRRVGLRQDDRRDGAARARAARRRASAAGRCVIDGRDLAGARRRATCAGCAAARSPTSRRTRARRSTRRCGCARSCAEMLEAHAGEWSDERARRAHARGARGGRAAVRRRVPRPLPAPALGRPAAARRDRDGVRLPAARDRLRRADHRPRRHDAGARARDGARAVPQPSRRGALRQPRPRRGGRAGRPRRGDVRRADRRDRHARPAVRRRAHPYTRRLLRAVPDLEGKRAVVGIPGHAPLPGQPAGRAASSTRAARSRRTSAAATFPPAFDVGGRAPRALPPRRRGARASCRSRAASRRSRRASARRSWCSPSASSTRHHGDAPHAVRRSSSRSTATSAWRSSASRARARRRSRAASPGCTRTTRATVVPRATTSSRRRRAQRSARRARRSSTSSRTRTRR